MSFQNKQNEPDSDEINVKLSSIITLRESTRKLLCLLDEIQGKINTKDAIPYDSILFTPQKSNKKLVDGISKSFEHDIIDLEKIETITKSLDLISEDKDDDCSIYKRLAGKCNCLNHPDYNDFVIHFNENTKYTTHHIGEIIKNVRILKKFMYMGGSYTKSALVFLNDGLYESSHKEKVEIIQGCSHADICNIFDEYSVVTFCISWPCKLAYYGDYVTQAQAASLLFKLAEMEEGRRYLNLNSKIINDIRKVLRKKSSHLESNTIEHLNATIDLLKPISAKSINVYSAKTMYEGMVTKIINYLHTSRNCLTLDEILMYLDIIKNFSRQQKGKMNIVQNLPALLVLFKHLLREYDNSEMNIIVMNTLKNIVSKSMIADISDGENSKLIAETTEQVIETYTEPISHTKAAKKKINKSTLIALEMTKKSCKNTKLKDLRRSIIIIPVEKKKRLTR